MTVRILKYHAPWCGPCRIMGPIVDRVAAKHSLEVKSYNIDDYEDECKMLNIKSVPTIILTNDDGEEIKRTGSLTESEFDKWISS